VSGKVLEGSRREALSIMVWRGLLSFSRRSVGTRQIGEQVKVKAEVKQAQT